MVLVTPHLVEPLNPAAMPKAPGEKWESPSENDLFLNQYLGGDRSSQIAGPTSQQATKVAQHGKPPVVFGQVGFVAPPTPIVGSPAPVASGRE